MILLVIIHLLHVIITPLFFSLKNSLVSISKFVMNQVGDKKYVCPQRLVSNTFERVLIILGMSVVGMPGEGDVKLGNPVVWDGSSHTQTLQTTQTTAHQAPSHQQAHQAPSHQQASAPKQAAPQRTQPMPTPTSNPPPTQANVFPIKALNPYQNKWTIKARIISKGEIKRWSNAKVLFLPIQSISQLFLGDINLMALTFNFNPHSLTHTQFRGKANYFPVYSLMLLVI